MALMYKLLSMNVFKVNCLESAAGTVQLHHFATRSLHNNLHAAADAISVHYITMNVNCLAKTILSKMNCTESMCYYDMMRIKVNLSAALGILKTRYIA